MLRRRLGGRRARLNVVIARSSRPADGTARHVIVYFVVHINLETGEEAEGAVVVTVIAAAFDAPVHPEAEQGKTEGRHVIDVPDDDPLAPHFNRDSASALDGYASVVGEGHKLSFDVFVADERVDKWPQVVCGSAV